MLRVSLATLALFGLASARIVPGQCTEPELKDNFEATSYIGRWFEIQRDNGQTQEAGYECQNAIISLQDDGLLALKNSMYNIETKDFQFVTGTAACTGAHCAVTIFGNKGDYRVLDTDYESYSLVYACSNVDESNKKVAAWILSRETSLPQETQDSLLSTLAERVPDYNQAEWLRSPIQGEACVYDHEPKVFL